MDDWKEILEKENSQAALLKNMSVINNPEYQATLLIYASLLTSSSVAGKSFDEIVDNSRSAAKALMREFNIE